jgi:predicted nucleic acid-binding protein
VIIVDTTVWIDYLRGARNRETEYLDRHAGSVPFGLTDLILCEVLQGIEDDESFANVLEEMSKFRLFENGGSQVAVEAASNFRRLRQQGQAVCKTIDCLIATFCLLDGHSLLHRDRDFDHFERLLGLEVVHA